MSTTKPEPGLVSVIVPTYNVAAMLDQCLVSIEGQTHRQVEVIVVNDGSTDESSAVAHAHAARDQRVVVVDKPNEGYGATCNRGLEMAHGQWVSVIEPDDWIAPTMYEDMLAFAGRFSQPVDIVKTPWIDICEWNCPSTQYARKSDMCGRVKTSAAPFSIAQNPVLMELHPSIWSAIYRTDFLRKNGIRFIPFPGAGWADNPFLVETLCQTDRIGYFDTAYYCYREETPEKSKNFAHSNTLLPLERWNDMMDVLERLGITDERILRAHNSRGFTYLSGIIEEVDLAHDDVREAAKHMFERMDADLVFSDNEVSPGMKRLYAGLRGIPCPKINPLPHMKGLVGQGVYNLKNTGVVNTLFATKNYLVKRARREGR